jgi:RNA polymerase sigma-70 factor (sigma-E family)
MDEPGDFRRFVVARSPALLRSAWLLTGNWATAQDLVQTALVKSWSHLGSIRASDDPEPYVRQVMVTTYASWWRRRWRAEIPTGLLPERADDDVYAAVDTRVALVQALGSLPPRQRAVVVLRYFDDLSEAQTAVALGCSVGTVKSQASKALATLRANQGLALAEAEPEVSS